MKNNRVAKYEPDKEKLDSDASDAINGNMAAFEKICELKQHELYIAALKHLKSPEDAEDAVQDTLISALEYIHTLKDPRALNSWLYRILYQRCVDIMRSKKRQVSIVTTDDDIEDIVPDENREYLPEKHLEDEEMSAELYKAILTLPEKSRETFILYYLSDMKYREIADITDTSIKTVSTNLIRAKHKLRTQLATTGMMLKGAFASKVSLIAQSVAVKVSIGTVGAICAAGVTWYAVAEEPAPLPEPEPANFNITMENAEGISSQTDPTDIGLEGIRSGDTVSAWDIVDAGGEVVYSGALDAVTAYITSLEKSASTHANVNYRLRCAITDKHGYKYNISREFVVTG
jgi:RNA polymerase sigma-70 factor (ECF subfamily)